MASYVVMEPPAERGVDPAERAVFIREGFAFIAFLIPPLWLLWHRLWLESAVVFAAALAIGMVTQALALGLAGSVLSLLLSIFVGLEGRRLLALGLARRGWHEWGVVEAGDAEEAETRYAVGVEELGETDVAENSRGAVGTSLPRATHVAAPTLGLVPFSRKH